MLGCVVAKALAIVAFQSEKLFEVGFAVELALQGGIVTGRETTTAVQTLETTRLVEELAVDDQLLEHVHGLLACRALV